MNGLTFQPCSVRGETSASSGSVSICCLVSSLPDASGHLDLLSSSRILDMVTSEFGDGA